MRTFDVVLTDPKTGRPRNVRMEGSSAADLRRALREKGIHEIHAIEPAHDNERQPATPPPAATSQRVALVAIDPAALKKFERAILRASVRAAFLGAILTGAATAFFLLVVIRGMS
ncbi:MAG: hypothetical protein VYC34_06975 [Planctomycetota bacterium]|nr:hypothetical protein [Planctomycetota bacterium]